MKVQPFKLRSMLILILQNCFITKHNVTLRLAGPIALINNYDCQKVEIAGEKSQNDCKKSNQNIAKSVDRTALLLPVVFL